MIKKLINRLFKKRTQLLDAEVSRQLDQHIEAMSLPVVVKSNNIISYPNTKPEPGAPFAQPSPTYVYPGIISRDEYQTIPKKLRSM